MQALEPALAQLERGQGSAGDPAASSAPTGAAGTPAVLAPSAAAGSSPARHSTPVSTPLKAVHRGRLSGDTTAGDRPGNAPTAGGHTAPVQAGLLVPASQATSASGQASVAHSPRPSAFLDSGATGCACARTLRLHLASQPGPRVTSASRIGGSCREATDRQESTCLACACIACICQA